MFVASDIERDKKANFAAAVVVDDPESEPQAVATSVYGTAAVAKIPIAVATGRSAFELGTVVDTREKRQTELCCGSCCDVSSLFFLFVHLIDTVVCFEVF